MGLQGVTSCYRRLQAVIGATRGYRRLQEVTGGCTVLRWVTGCYKG